ncbi:TPA: phage baseplate assembly protein [Yersinia enterocolitica]
MSEPLTLSVNGQIFGGWTDMVINRSLDSIAGEFDLTVTAQWSDAAPRTIKPGMPCSVDIGPDRVLTGYIDDFIPSYDATSVSLRVLGRDKTGDLVDSSVVDKSGQWRGQKLEQIAATICKPYGVQVITETDTGDTFSNITLEQGETGFELLDRMAKQRGVLMTSDAWRENNDSGSLWQTNKLVQVEDTIQQLNVIWLIKTVSFSEGDNGRLTVLSLVPPESMDMPAENTKRKKGKKGTEVGVTWD